MDARCSEFLERPAEQPFGEAHSGSGYTRNIDLVIHVDYWEKIRMLSENNENDIYYKAQQDIINLVSGCELAIFNDPTTNYPSRETFCGVTGTMTNILTGGFFHLYLHVLKVPGIQVNTCTDLVTIFDHLYTYCKFEYRFLIDDIELSAIKEIISLLVERKNDLFTNEWFDALVNIYKEVHTISINRGRDTFYWNQPTIENLRRSRGFSEKYKSLFPKECGLEWRDDSIIGDYPDRPSYLEKYGAYNIYTGQNSEIIEESLFFIGELRRFFNPSNDSSIISDIFGGYKRSKKSRRYRKPRTKRKSKKNRRN